MPVGSRRTGVYGGWTRAAGTRVFVRVPSGLKERAEHSDGLRPDWDELEPGSAPTVLVHGLSSSRTLRPLIRALGARLPVYAPDLPGFGLSDQPIHPLDIPGLAAALRRWLLENDLAPANLVGTSLGSQVAVDLAVHYPAAVERLVLVGPAFDPKARRTGRLALRWARNAPRWSPRFAPTVMHDLIDAGPWRSLQTLRESRRYRIERKLSRVAAPALIVRPEHDHLVPEAWTERVAELIPNSELVVLPRAGHSIGTRTANRLAPLLLPFLSGGDYSEPEKEPASEERPVKGFRKAFEPAPR